MTTTTASRATAAPTTRPWNCFQYIPAAKNATNGRTATMYWGDAGRATAKSIAWATVLEVTPEKKPPAELARAYGITKIKMGITVPQINGITRRRSAAK